MTPRKLKILPSIGTGLPGRIWKPEFSIGPDVFSARYSQDGDMAAIACVDGGVRVYSTTSEHNKITQKLYVNTKTLPATSVRWRPAVPGIAAKILLVTGSDGTAVRFDLSTGRAVNKVEEPGNEIYCGDYRHDGRQFCTVGKDFICRVYSEETNTLATSIGGSSFSGAGEDVKSGHSNRVFSVKWLPGSDFIFLTAGWDDTIQMMDTRMGGSIRSFSGPHVAGDALDLYDNMVVAGSWAPKDQIQIFDIRNTQLLHSIQWNPESAGASSPDADGQPYSLQISSSGRFFAAGGSGTSEVRVYSLQTRECLAVVDNLAKPIHTVAFDSAEKRIIAGGAGGVVVMADL